ncbi:hypothetical protein [Streptomyces monashensis]|uniref:Uncharacterized protein n=1 Tax=Streptomyces monashensis TaxID=1678012 RepID=A0A1S2P2Q9_9ACTN|nr:hypothetical protein [Streptomyces monashensis]OIJ87695.1 hypothetical protein BIV23_42560 [Streptomyces monashensis]
MTKSIKRILVSASVFLLGIAAQTASASAVTVRPMTFDECGHNGDSGVDNCMYISGAGLYASEVRGWSTHVGFGYPVHEEVTGPNGVVCNSATVTTGDGSAVVGCQIYPNKNIAAGTYCSILWEYQGGKYYNDAENCGTVSG